jgi:FkbM family methyltransferase
MKCQARVAIADAFSSRKKNSGGQPRHSPMRIRLQVAFLSVCLVAFVCSVSLLVNISYPVHRPGQDQNHFERLAPPATKCRRDGIPRNLEGDKRCRSALENFQADLESNFSCEDASWHAFAAERFCFLMQKLRAHFDDVRSSTDVSFPIDVSPLPAEIGRLIPFKGSPMNNACHRTIASLSDVMALNLDRNKCSLCEYDHHLIAYCYYLVFRSAAVLMNVSRPQNELYHFQIPVSRVPDIDAYTWVTGEYPKRVVQSLAAAGVEKYNFEVLKHVLKDCNSDSVVNIGANDGFYTFASSTRGCRTISFEPQIGCLQNLYFNAMLPIFAATPLKPPLLYNAFVSDADFSVDSGTSCDGGAQFTKQGARTSNTLYTPDQEPWTHPGGAKVPVKSMRLGDAVTDDIRLLLIDVEGAEVSVLRACETLIETKSIFHAIIEWNVNRWDRFGLNATVGAEHAFRIAVKANWECRVLNSPDVATMESSEFSRGEDLVALFSGSTKGKPQQFSQQFFEVTSRCY